MEGLDVLQNLAHARHCRREPEQVVHGQRAVVQVVSDEDAQHGGEHFAVLPVPVLRVQVGHLCELGQNLIRCEGGYGFDHDVIFGLELFAEQSYEVGNINRLVLLLVPPLDGIETQLDILGFGGEKLVKRSQRALAFF